jgi:hypothetical protein
VEQSKLAAITGSDDRLSLDHSPQSMQTLLHSQRNVFEEQSASLFASRPRDGAVLELFTEKDAIARAPLDAVDRHTRIPVWVLGCPRGITPLCRPVAPVYTTHVLKLFVATRLMCSWTAALRSRDGIRERFAAP